MMSDIVCPTCKQGRIVMRNGKPSTITVMRSCCAAHFYGEGSPSHAWILKLEREEERLKQPRSEPFIDDAPLPPDGCYCDDMSEGKCQVCIVDDTQKVLALVLMAQAIVDTQRHREFRDVVFGRAYQCHGYVVKANAKCPYCGCKAPL